jgi:hypothetical protein
MKGRKVIDDQIRSSVTVELPCQMIEKIEKYAKKMIVV